ncbi:MAG TPA: hypothetical protein VF053_05040 [Streptosporangiales bacterium]
MSYAAAGLFTFIPVLVFVTGLILALVTRGRHPRRSTFAAIGFAVLIVDGLIGTVWNIAGPQLRVSHRWPVSLYAALSGLFGAVETLLLIAGWVLILIALFGRERTTPAYPQAGGPPAPQQPPFPGGRPPGY